MAIEVSQFFIISEIYGHDQIYSGYRSLNSNSPNGSAWKYLKSYTGTGQRQLQDETTIT